MKRKPQRVKITLKIKESSSVLHFRCVENSDDVDIHTVYLDDGQQNLYHFIRASLPHYLDEAKKFARQYFKGHVNQAA